MFGITAAAIAAFSAVASAAPAATSAAANSSETEFPELAHFFSNNSQWANAKAKEDPSFFPTLNASQHPGIVWVGCSDSRVPESVITHQNPGSIFTLVSHSERSRATSAPNKRGRCEPCGWATET